MAYQSWSVVFGEQPSAAKWNILGTNDASFNDGTGIANSVIDSENLIQTIGFHAYRNTAKTIGNSVVDVIHDTERYDLGSDFNTTTGVFTCPVAGRYLFVTNLEAGATGQTRVLVSFVGSTFGTRIVFDTTGTDVNKANGSLLIDCALSETVKVQALLSVNGDVADVETYFAGTFLG